MHSATDMRDGRLGWILAFGAILLLSIPLDRWTGTPAWLAAAWGFLASNQAIFAILLAGAVLVKALVLEPSRGSGARTPHDPLALSTPDRRLLSAVLQLPSELPLLRWAGRLLLVVGALLGFRWLRAMMTLNTGGEFRNLLGEVFWVLLLGGLAWLCLRLIHLVRALHLRIRQLLAELD